MCELRSVYANIVDVALATICYQCEPPVSPKQKMQTLKLSVDAFLFISLTFRPHKSLRRKLNIVTRPR